MRRISISYARLNLQSRRHVVAKRQISALFFLSVSTPEDATHADLFFSGSEYVNNTGILV